MLPTSSGPGNCCPDSQRYIVSSDTPSSLAICQRLISRDSRASSDDPNPVKTKEKADEDEITLDDIEFALFGEVRELTEEEKEELLRNARRMNELRKFKRKNQLDDE